MMTTLNPAHVRQPRTLYVPTLSSAAEVAKFATEKTVKAWTAFDADTTAHNAAVKSWHGQLEAIAKGDVDPATASTLPATISKTRVELTAAALALKARREAMLETLKADYNAHHDRKKVELDTAAKAAEPKAKEVFPDNPGQQQNAINSMCRKEIEAWHWTPRFVAYDTDTTSGHASHAVTKYALALAVLDAAGVSGIVSIPDKADL